MTDEPVNNPHDDPVDKQLAGTELTDRARMLAVELVGLTPDRAAERVASVPGLTLRTLARDQAVTLEFRVGRINVIVEDGVVVDASVG